MAIPVLQCTNLDESLVFYTGALGADVLWRNPEDGDPGYAAVKWRDHELHLSSHRGDGVAGTAVFFRVDDVDELFRELGERGWTPPEGASPVEAAPVDQTWGIRELYVRDPDRNCLRFGTES